MNISWLSLNASWSHSSLALPLLEQCCVDHKNWRWSLVESTINEGPNKTIEELLSQKPDVLLATCYLFTIDAVLSIVSRFKKVHPNVKIILGGPEFLGSNERFLLNHDYIDAVVRGEGEAVIEELLRAFETNSLSELKNVPGICVRTDSNTVFDNNLHASELAMEHLSDPFNSPFFNWDKGFIQLETSRGCQSHCSFCTSAVSNGGRMLKVDEVQPILERIRKSGVKAVRILDRTFNYPKERALELLRLFLVEYVDLHFHLEIYPNLISDEMLELISSAKPGQLHIEIGIQATSPSVLNAIKRSLFNKRAFDVLGQLCDMPAVPIHTDLIIGLPQQTMTDVIEDLRKLAIFQPEEIQVEVLKILNGTPLTNELQKWGTKHSEMPPYEVLQTDTLSYVQIRQCMRFSRLLDHFYNDCELRRIVGHYWSKHPDLWEQIDSFLREQLDVMSPLSLKARYTWLYQYFLNNDPVYADELALEWIKLGHSPLKGLVEAELWKTEIPEGTSQLVNSDLIFENTNQVNRDAKTFFLSLKTKDVWLRLFKKNQKEILILNEWERAKS